MSDFEESSVNSVAVQKFHDDGFCVLPQCFDVDLVQKAHTKAESNFDEVLGHIAKHQLEFGIGIKHGFKEIVQRHPLRYEMPYKMDDTFFDFVLQHQQLISTVKTILQSDEVVIANRSCVMSLSGAECQAWHSDGPHVSVTEYLTCHVLNVFVPLVPITVDNGPTEFRPGSQKYSNNLAKGMLLAKIKKQIKPIEAPLLELGDVLMFDYRVLHRGGANISTQRRPILVFTFAKPWYKDNLNFPARSVHHIPSGENKEDQVVENM